MLKAVTLQMKKQELSWFHSSGLRARHRIGDWDCMAETNLVVLVSSEELKGP